MNVKLVKSLLMFKVVGSIVDINGGGFVDTSGNTL